MIAAPARLCKSTARGLQVQLCKSLLGLACRSVRVASARWTASSEAVQHAGRLAQRSSCCELIAQRDVLPWGAPHEIVQRSQITKGLELQRFLGRECRTESSSGHWMLSMHLACLCMLRVKGGWGGGWWKFPSKSSSTSYAC